jgi:ATPase subunit of ABC transporter with duplicated ATPase domains
VAHVEAAHVDYYLPDGRMLLADVSFRVGDGQPVALVGANGAGKTTLLRLLTGEIAPDAGSVTVSGSLGVMPQFVGSVRDDRSVRDLLVSVAPPRIQQAARAVDEAELAIMTTDDEAAQLAYAQALSDWGEAGGYHTEALWDICTMAALGAPYEKAQWRAVSTLSGGWCWRRCCAARMMCCCWTSRTTTWTCRASSGWNSSCGTPARPWCSSRTTGSCWPGRRAS